MSHLEMLQIGIALGVLALTIVMLIYDFIRYKLTVEEDPIDMGDANNDTIAKQCELLSDSIITFEPCEERRSFSYLDDEKERIIEALKCHHPESIEDESKPDDPWAKYEVPTYLRRNVDITPMSDFPRLMH